MAPRRCAYVEGKKACSKPGDGNPPLCAKHRELLEEEDEDDFGSSDVMENLMGTVMEHPRVQGVFTSVTSVIDRFSQILDNTAAGRRPDGTRWSEPRQSEGGAEPRGGEGAPPPRKHARRPAPPPPPDNRRQIEEAYTILGLDPKTKLTKEILKKRKQELSRLYHPDRGGSLEMMKRLNVASDLLLKTLE